MLRHPLDCYGFRPPRPDARLTRRNRAVDRSHPCLRSPDAPLSPPSPRRQPARFARRPAACRAGAGSGRPEPHLHPARTCSPLSQAEDVQISPDGKRIALHPRHRRHHDRRRPARDLAGGRRQRTPAGAGRRRQRPAALVAGRHPPRLRRARGGRRQAADLGPLVRDRRQCRTHRAPRTAERHRLVARSEEHRLHHVRPRRRRDARLAAGQARGRQVGRSAQGDRPGPLPGGRARLSAAGLPAQLRGVGGWRRGAPADLRRL